MNGMANALNRTSHSQISPESWLALPNHKFAMVSAAKNATTTVATPDLYPDLNPGLYPALYWNQ
jgi:hypothetical protein